MFAKLVLNTQVIGGGGNLIRDIGRLITSATPSTSLLNACSQASSIIYDATPAGWTYVGSNYSTNVPTITTGTGYAALTTDSENLCFSAPCLSGSALKYAILNTVWGGTATNLPSPYADAIVLTGAQSATSAGVTTNQGGRAVRAATTAGGTQITIYGKYEGIDTTTNGVIYVIANARHITIIKENVGIMAIWESSMTNAHSFYGTAPFVRIMNVGDSTGSLTGIPPITKYTVTAAATTPIDTGQSSIAEAYNVTNPNNGTNYGVLDLSSLGGLISVYANQHSLVQRGLVGLSNRSNTIDANGLTRYVISPVYYQMMLQGYPVQYITGVVPVYWTAGGMGTTGDTVDVSGDTYTFFNCGTHFGVIMKTT